MSWKQYGGLGNLSKSNNINTNNISTNTIILKKAYTGDFRIDGTIYVAQNAYISGNTFLETCNVDNLNIFKTVNFNNSVTIGNLDIQTNLKIDGNIFLEKSLYFSNSSQYMYGNILGVGINTLNPVAGLDINTTNFCSISVKSNKLTNRSILTQTSGNKGIILTSSAKDAYIDMFVDKLIPTDINTTGSYNTVPPPGDVRIRYASSTYTNRPPGSLDIDVSNNISLLTKGFTVSKRLVNGFAPPHINNETVIVYDTSSSTVFAGNIYNNPVAYMGSALSLISTDLSSNTTLYITNPNKIGAAYFGGAYPIDTTRSMNSSGIVDICGNYTVGQMIVSGNDLVKYPSTTGINTYQPRTEKYVADINGPIHIDNGDITIVNNSNFQIYSTSMSNTNKNVIMAVGSSYDISGSYRDPSNNNIPAYREKILYSDNFGKSWSTIDLSNSIIANLYTNGSGIKNTYVYDASYSFITGNNNTILYSFDSSRSWQQMLTGQISSGINYNNFKLSPNTNINGNLNAYFTVDISSTFCVFDLSLGDINTKRSTGNTLIKYPSIYSSSINPIRSIAVNTSSIYLAGNGIAKYNVSNLNNSVYTHNIGISDYNSIYSFDNSFVIAVGTNIISNTKDGGNTWTDFSNNVVYNSVYIYDTSNAVAVGTLGNIWSTTNSAVTWTYIPNNLINPSGKSYMITNPANNLSSIVMPDPNTILISNTIQNYVQSTTYGKSSIINCFIPNFVNRTNNNIIDVCGNMIISGDINVNSGGQIKSNNSQFFLLNSQVQSLNFAGDASNIIIGNTVGNTYIRNNMNVSLDAYVSGNVNVTGNVNATYFNTTSDYRIKEDPIRIDGTVDLLNPVYYKNKISEKYDMGFLAHELQQVFPFLVNGDKDGDQYQNINYTGLIALLVKEIQELKQTNNELNVRISNIEKTVGL